MDLNSKSIEFGSESRIFALLDSDPGFDPRLESDPGLDPRLHML